jgi:hypothetical protein
MKVTCACLNNLPEPLENDIHGGDRFQCFYCKFKWRYICNVMTECIQCSFLLENRHCKICKITYTQDTKKILVFW